MGKPLHQRVVPETYVQLLYEYLEAQGHSPEAVLGAPWPTPNPQGIGGIDVQRWEEMLELAEARLADPLIGLHVGQTITARHVGVLGAVLLASENLMGVVQRLDRYQRLIYDVNPMAITSGPGWVGLAWDVSAGRSGRLVEQTGYAVITQFTRDIVRGAISPLVVRFCCEEPDSIAPYEAYFGCPVLFNQSEPGLRFSPEVLTLPLKSPNPSLIAVLEQHADRLLGQLPQQEEIVEQVRREIAHALREGEPDIGKVSGKLNCSSRTLQRRLTQAGTSFRSELNLVRHQLAEGYLRDQRLQVVDIALLLGYSEHSAFTRAYREWSGKTPNEAREAFR